MVLHPQLIEKDGKEEYVVLPYEEYVALLERAQDYEDLSDLRAAKAECVGEPGIPLDEAVKELDL